MFGGRYDPDGDRWTPIAAPPGRVPFGEASALVWTGAALLADGAAAWDPAADRWWSLPAPGGWRWVGAGPPVRPLSDAPLVPSPAAPASDASRCGPKPFGAEQPASAWKQFDVTRAQLELINRRLFRVLCREGLWRKGVGFGAGYDPDRETEFVMIHPGFSGLTARQILDRLLGR